MANELYNVPLDRLPCDRQIDSWRKTDESVLPRIEKGDRLEMKQILEEKGHTDWALHRGEQLHSIAQTAWPPGLKHCLTLLVGTFSAIVVGGSMATIVDATGRGPIAAAGGALAGGACATLADIWSSRYMKERHMRYLALQAQASIREAQAKEQLTTEFTDHYFTSEEQLLTQTEALHLAQEPKADALMALGSITAEGIIVLFLTLPAGLPLALASATFPIMVNLLIAKVQSDRFEVPEACEALLPAYEAHIPPETIPALEALKIAELHAALQYVSTTRPSNGVRSVGQTKGKAKVEIAQQCLTILNEQGVEVVRHCQEQHQADLEDLPNHCPEPDIDIAGLTAEEAAQAAQDWRENWREQEEQKLDKKHEDNLNFIKAQYSQAIKHWEEMKNQGMQEAQG